ncbi:Hch1p KNAG_0K02240 [Huiozyma naganishii CBS 8797]|uniref:Activator of Hsp90 ATPase AHSA1-like N-terminal domain-containing protein n=1 Tax=Huiozyma naganishii (strain ATCC MYA-139 / BCRC 22969 / CBS 8797 / KCTC 17520 / NBRC 10181 / NCYC 3082 / Yp74L-3) TaxID=1071383 RepID=J7S3F7_HUIN7|nr:hypothetical protein KNAG_0K02240 [Kazachstania naganishii CBS 8797]CCK72587.1 hypothetical protein KNAG_0K02240 [Kazachstania naganishii CBS 8797]
MVVLNPNNWHWVDKNTLPWTQEYLTERLVGFKVDVNNDSAEEGAVHSVEISKVNKVAGDSNVSQRKGKPICYFDLDLAFDIVAVVDASADAETKDAETVAGSVQVPEFMHDEDDFEIKVSGLDARLTELVKQQFVPSFRATLLEYQTDLINEHSKYLEES